MFTLVESSMTLKSRELFSNNKITEALCQIRFEHPVDANKFELFWTELQRENIYVEKQQMPMIHFNFNLSESTPTQSTFNGLKFINEKKDKVVQIFSDNISIHQVGNYQNWESFRDNIHQNITTLQKIFDCNVVRIDLRTINIFEFNENENLSDYFTIYLNTPPNDAQSFNFNFAIEHSYEPGNSFGVLRANGNINKGVKKIVLDLSYVFLCLENKINIQETEKLNAVLEDGHEKLYTLFITSVTDKTKKLIK